MTTRETAEAFCALLKAGRHEEAAAQFNAEDIVSHEAMEGPMARLEGKAAVKGKSDWWYANHEWHGGGAEGPFVNGDRFAVIFDMDVTAKETGQRMQMREVGLYTVKGKSDWWYANHEWHGGGAEGPFVNGDRFAVIFDMDVTAKETGQRMQMREVGLYTVRDGKIVEERFFY